MGAPGGNPNAAADAACRAQVRAQGLIGEQRRDFLRNCRAPIVSACRQQVRAQGLPPEARRNAMRACMGRPPRG
jgi:hypothetical protein